MRSLHVRSQRCYVRSRDPVPSLWDVVDTATLEKIKYLYAKGRDSTESKCTRRSHINYCNKNICGKLDKSGIKQIKTIVCLKQIHKSTVKEEEDLLLNLFGCLSVLSVFER